MLVVGFTILATQSKFIPYIVEIDKLGKIYTSGPAEQIKTPNQRIIKAALAGFIEDIKSVTTDNTVQKRSLEKAYAFLPKGSSAAVYVQDYIINNSFSERTKTVAVEISTVLPLSGKSWQIEWIEISRNLQGKLLNEKKWRAVVSIEFNTPTNEEAIMLNPLGLYITQLNWSQQL